MKTQQYIRKALFSLLLVVPFMSGVAQDVAFTLTEEVTDVYWFKGSEDKGCNGISWDKAIERLAGMKPKKVVVALIGQGINVEHKDLKSSIWKNSKEIAGNGKDDDRNGYVDDINGWNFIGLANGESCKEQLTEYDRAFLRLNDKYKGLRFRNEKQSSEAKYFFDVVLNKSVLGRKSLTLSFMEYVKDKMDEYERIIRKQLPDKRELTSDDFIKYISVPDAQKDSIGAMAYAYVSMSFSIAESVGKSGSFTWLKNVGLPDLLAQTQKEYDVFRSKYVSDRSLVGDKLSELKDIKGNNIVVNNDNEYITATEGVIAQIANVNGQNSVEFMGLKVASTNEGEPYDKDLANAIRYAVDNGAQVIDIYKGKEMLVNKKWVEDALTYAKAKDVLVVYGAGDESLNLDEKGNELYPIKNYSKGKDMTSLICVGASDKDGFPARFTNYGNKSVDVFAPGFDIYTCGVDDKYITVSSSMLASSMVTGVIALLKAYYPSLTSQQIKDLLISQVDSKKGVDVPLPTTSKDVTSIIDFGTMCVSGGIVNVNKILNAINPSR